MHNGLRYLGGMPAILFLCDAAVGEVNPAADRDRNANARNASPKNEELAPGRDARGTNVCAVRYTNVSNSSVL